MACHGDHATAARLAPEELFLLFDLGGAGALIARSIRSVEVVAYPELNTEAIRRLEVKNLPLIVANDIHGGDLYLEGVRQYCRNF